jgi:hypothetical protein
LGGRLPGRVTSSFALCLAAVLTAAVAGCSGYQEMAENVREGNLFQKPVFTTPDWARVRPITKASLGPSGPVSPEELVDASGRCAAKAPAVPAQAEAAQASAPAAPAEPAKPAKPPAYGSVAGDLASAPMPQGAAPKPMPVSAKRASAAHAADMDRLQPEGSFAGFPGMGAPVLGGIALGMTECQAVRRAGQPSNVSIASGGNGARKVVLTYLSGPWPGIYTFDSGRLKVVDAAPVQEKPAKGKSKRRYKKKAHKPARTARGEDVYVQ